MSDDAIVALSARQGPLPPLPALHPFAGAFVIPDVFDPSQQFMSGMGDGRRIWTPSLRVASDADKVRMLDEYVKRPYTHFVYNVAGSIYHDDYGPPAPDDPRAARADLELIRRYKLAPVVAACDDQDGGNVTPWLSFSVNVDLIAKAFPMWEMNGPLGIATYNGDGTFSGRIVDCIRNVAAAIAAGNPACEHHLHFTSGHGSIGEPEREGWRFCRDAFKVRGLFSQDEGYERNAQTADPEGTAAGLQDTAERLGTLGLLNTRFEQITYPTYNKATRAKWAHYDEHFQREYGRTLGRLAPSTDGFADGSY